MAVRTPGKIGTKAARALLEEAHTFWEKSDYEDAWRVRDAISQALNLGDKTADLRTILEKAGADRWINTELPKIALEYFRRTPEKASELLVSALRSHGKKGVYAGTLASAVLAILPQIPLTEGLLAAAIDLAKRLPGDTFAWRTIARVWQRRDISDRQRALFFASIVEGHV